jgi:hypothetical protein
MSVKNWNPDRPGTYIMLDAYLPATGKVHVMKLVIKEFFEFNYTDQARYYDREEATVSRLKEDIMLNDWQPGTVVDKIATLIDNWKDLVSHQYYI